MASYLKFSFKLQFFLFLNIVSKKNEYFEIRLIIRIIYDTDEYVSI